MNCLKLWFQFQTNAPKSCFMRPSNGILAPKESILAAGNKISGKNDELITYFQWRKQGN